MAIVITMTFLGRIGSYLADKLILFAASAL